MPDRKIDVKNISVEKGDVTVKVTFSRFEKQLQMAQWVLDTDVMLSMEPFMPGTGKFKQLTKEDSAALAGTGIVIAAHPPYGRFLYYGKKMVDSVTGKGPMKIPTGPKEFVWRYRKGAKLVATDQPLKYSNPRAVPKWFDAAKKADMDKWLADVKETAGGGKK